MMTLDKETAIRKISEMPTESIKGVNFHGWHGSRTHY